MRLKVLLLVGVVAALGGCQTKTVEEMGYAERNALAKQIVQRCMNQGIKPDTAEFNRCMRVEVDGEVASRRRRAARQDAAVAAGAGRVTTCRNVFGTVICS